MRILIFYDEINKQINDLLEIDEAIEDLQKKNPSKLQVYEIFKSLTDTMEQGQRYGGASISQGFNETHEQKMMEINQEFSRVYQYRKFAYKHFMTYLDTGSLKEADTSKEWMRSAHSSMSHVIFNLEALKSELEPTDSKSEAEDEEAPISLEKDNIPLKYEIVYTEKGLRYDGGVYYFVLIEPVDISSTLFKEDIKELVRDITTKMGRKISIEFYDDKDALKYGHMAIAGSIRDWEAVQKDTKKLNKLVRHGIASFSGELKTGFFYNTLWFFIHYDQVDKSSVDNLAELVEFNP